MRSFVGIGLAVLTLCFAGCWDYSAMKRDSGVEYRRQMEARLPEARRRAEEGGALTEGDRKRVEGEMPEMEEGVEDELFARTDNFVWKLEGGRVLRVVYFRMETDAAKEWKVTVEGGKK